MRILSYFRWIPEKLASWRHLDPEHHHACFRCSSTDKLTTIALERAGIVYGFMFTCGKCLMRTGRGTKVVWRIKQNEVPEQ